MREREGQHDEPRLFDLPLEAESEAADRPDEPAEAEPEAPPAVTPSAEPPELPLFAPGSPPAHPPAESLEPPAEPNEVAALGPRAVPDIEDAFASADSAHGPTSLPQAPLGSLSAPFRPRLIAVLADLGVYGLVFVVGVLGALMIGAAPALAKLPAFCVFLLSFSFLYAVVSLAFWGQTPGMAAAGVVARGGGDQPLTFGQTGLRWLAGVLTAVLLGLPVLLALTGRSLADRLSGSGTYLTR